jgi:hypothetical protein
MRHAAAGKKESPQTPEQERLRKLQRDARAFVNSATRISISTRRESIAPRI